MKLKASAGLVLIVLLILAGCAPPTPEWELANPIEPLPEPPLGVKSRSLPTKAAASPTPTSTPRSNPSI